jgi:hypothetical protein
VDSEVTIAPVASRRLAAVRRRIPRTEIGASWGPALDQVWTFLRANPGLRDDGHNVFVYRHLGGGIMDAAFGVEVVRDFEAQGEVEPICMPEGEAASLVHVGDYAGLGVAHDRVMAGIAEAGRAQAGLFWEIYGDWTEDPAKLETTVGYLLRARP